MPSIIDFQILRYSDTLDQMMLRYIILLLALTFVGCGDYRGYQGLPAVAEQQQDILIEFGNEDSLDENNPGDDAGEHTA